MKLALINAKVYMCPALGFFAVGQFVVIFFLNLPEITISSYGETFKHIGAHLLGDNYPINELKLALINLSLLPVW